MNIVINIILALSVFVTIFTLSVRIFNIAAIISNRGLNWIPEKVNIDLILAASAAVWYLILHFNFS